MNTLSLIANIIAVVGASQSAVQKFQKLRRIRHTPQQVSQLLSEVYNFQAVVAEVQRSLLDSVHQPQDTLFMQHLAVLIQRAMGQITKIDEVAQIGLVSDIDTRDDHSMKALWEKWLKQKDLQKLCNNLYSTRQNVAAALTILTASEVPRVRSTLRGVVLVNQEIKSTLQRIDMNTTRDLNSIRTKVSGASTRIGEIETSVRGFSLVYGTRPRSASQSVPRDESGVRKRDSIPTEQRSSNQFCRELCLCNCHKPRKFVSPTWAHSLIGVIIMSWSNALGRPICNETRCERSRTSMLKVHYYFPSWFLQRVVLVHHHYMAVEGHILSVRTPRVVPYNSPIFIYAARGVLSSIQTIFSQGLASPYDVDRDGCTALVHAIRNSQYDVCRLLLEQNADPRHECENLYTPITYVWARILLQPDDPVTQSLKALFGPLLDRDEDLQPFGFTMMHQIALGLTTINLDDLLHLTTEGIDSLCNLGRTPLSWAVRAGRKSAVKSLLHYGARLDIKEIHGENVFYHATYNPDTEILTLLLREAYSRSIAPLSSDRNGLVGGRIIQENRSTSFDDESTIGELLDVCPTGAQSETPMMRALKDNRIAHIRLFLKYGANPDAPSDVLSGKAYSSCPILAAVEENSHEALEFLLKCGARRGVVDGDNMGILHLAGAVGDLRTLKILTRAEICCLSTTEKDAYGHTPLQAFEDDRPKFVFEDEETHRSCREEFVKLLEGIIPSDREHNCTVNGFKSPTIIESVNDKSDDLDEDQFFNANSEFETA